MKSCTVLIPEIGDDRSLFFAGENTDLKQSTTRVGEREQLHQTICVMHKAHGCILFDVYGRLYPSTDAWLTTGAPGTHLLIRRIATGGGGFMAFFCFLKW